MVTGKREADFLKITENCQILFANKQKTAFFSKISNANIAFWDLSKRSLVNFYYNVLFVNLATSGSRVMAKTALNSR